jgi:hypothetical protein
MEVNDEDKASKKATQGVDKKESDGSSSDSGEDSTKIPEKRSEKDNLDMIALMEKLDTSIKINEDMMEKHYPGYKTMSHRQRKQYTPPYDYYDEDGDPFDPMNGSNWDGDQQIGFRD